MALPTSYTDREFSQYLDRVLGPVADALNWATGTDPDSAGDYEEILNETMLTMGINAITEVDADNIYKFRTLARLQAWKAVAAQTAADYTFSADGGSYSREQIQAHALTMLDLARSDAAQFDPAYAVQVDEVSYGNDPHADYDDQLTDYIEAL